MRFAVPALLACLSACSLTGTGNGGECVRDDQCGDDLCARSGECLGASNLRQVTVKWTVNGANASAATCAAHPDLYVRFDGPDYGDTLRFAPVPCSQGSFFVDKLPRRYQQVELGLENSTGDVTSIDVTTAQAQFDLLH
jgi:hypothetical protein